LGLALARRGRIATGSWPGCSLIAAESKPLGYVATRDLTLLQ